MNFSTTSAPLQSAVAKPVPATTRARRRPEWRLCLALAALWFGFTLSWRPLAIPDEGRYVGVAWEMLRGGDWLVPTLDGLPFFHKPPLFYWITAGAMSLLGPGAAAARVAPWLSAVTITTGLFAFVSRWVGRSQAWATVLVLATMPLFYGAAQYANMDLLVAACVTSAVLLAAHATLARGEGQGFRVALAAAYLAAALGVLSKGLIGVVLPLLVLTTWSLATRRLGKVATLLMWGPGWMIFAAIAVPWFVLVQERFPGFDHYFFVVQHLQRFASSGFNNAKPWWFYGAVLLVLTLPWSPWLLVGWRRMLQTDRVSSDVTVLMIVWPIVVAVFFSVPGSKLVGYVLPALPPLAYLVADAARRWLAARAMGTSDRRWRATIAVAAVACVAFTAVAHYEQPKSRQALGETLGVLKRPGERVFFLDNFYYDVMFHARLDAPVSVVDAWLPADVAQDSWRRELTDAEHLAPAGSARRLMLPPALAPALCRGGSGWIVGPWPAGSERRWLADSQPAYHSVDTGLWHVDPSEPSMRAALGCAPASP